MQKQIVLLGLLRNVPDDAHQMMYSHLLTLLDGELAWIADRSTWLGAKTGEKR